MSSRLHRTVVVLVSVFLGGIAGGARIPEPDTILYGKVVNRSGVQEVLITEGRLVWEIEKADGQSLRLETRLLPLGGGAFSYRLKVPHEARSAGLEAPASNDHLPLTGSLTKQYHAEIQINNHPARILSPGGGSFDLDQLRRGGSLRVDLEVNYQLPDSDGDSMPDWWEEKYGLDLNSDDSAGDFDGDGSSNLAEFLSGTDPSADNRKPELVTREFVVYAGARTGILPAVVDTDTTAKDLAMTISSLPASGELIDQLHDQPLEAGTTWTMADLQSGRLIYVASEDGPVENRFTVSISDGTHPVVPAELKLKTHRVEPESLESLPGGPERKAIMLGALPIPGSESWSDESRRLFRNTLWAENPGTIVWDLASQRSSHTLEAGSPDYRMLLRGGSGNDELSGGDVDDVLYGGPGEDTLEGGRGADRFVLDPGQNETDTISDFSPHEGDVIDLAALFEGQSGRLDAFVALEMAGNEIRLGIDLDGDGSGFNDRVIRLRDFAQRVADPDLFSLWADGHLVAGALSLPPRVEISSTGDRASENGPTPVEVTLTRSGSVQEDLEVLLLVTGSAVNGVDYQRVELSQVIPAGASEARITITPFQDALPEPAEMVEIVIAENVHYERGPEASVRVSIDDLMPEISLSPLVGLTSVSSGVPGVILLQRTGIIDRDVLVRLQVNGSATPGQDVIAPPAFIRLGPGQTTALIEIKPLANAQISNGAESVHLEIAPDFSYRIKDGSESERVILIEEETSFAAWRNDHGEVDPAISLEDFATLDPGNLGVNHLLRYAFGIDPSPASGGAWRKHLPETRVTEGHLEIEFSRLPAATDLTYRVEASSNLVDWQPANGLLEEVPNDPGQPDLSRVTFRSLTPTGDHAFCYLRIHVSRTP